MTAIPVQHLDLRIYDRSITVDEHRQLRAAVEMAGQQGIATTVDQPGAVAAIVPLPVLEWYLAMGLAECPPCSEGRHRDCPRHYADSEKHPCGCDNRSVHTEITIAQVTYLRLSRRRV